jgi:hypothetical protein
MLKEAEAHEAAQAKKLDRIAKKQVHRIMLVTSNQVASLIRLLHLFFNVRLVT